MSDDLLKNSDVEIREVGTAKDGEIRFDITKLNASNFKRMVQYYDSISISPVEYLLTGTLAALSGAIGKSVYFSITSSMKVYLNVWAVLIGKSTIMRKTTALNLVTEDLQRIHTKNYNRYLRDLEEYENMSKEEKKKAVKPKRSYFLFPSDSTVESLAQILSESKRGLLLHSEFGSFLQQLNRGYSGDAKQFLTNLYDNPLSYEISRTTRENTILVRPFISILGASTIDWVRENSTDVDLRSGFFARFLYAIRNVPDKEFIPLLKLKSLTKRSEFYFDIRSVYEHLIDLNETELEITEEASELHINYDIQSFKELLNSENDNELSFKARLLIYCLKFAGIIALTEGRNIVTLSDMQDAIHITNYYKLTVEQLLNNELTKDEFARKEENILRKLKLKGGKISRTNLLNSVPYKAKELDEILGNLIEKEKIQEIKERVEGGKSTRFYLLIK